MGSLLNVSYIYGQARGMDGFCGSQRYILFCPYPWRTPRIFEKSLGISSKIDRYF